jgi:hypothetical protein
LIQIASPTVYPNSDLSQMVIYSGGAVSLHTTAPFPGCFSTASNPRARGS